MKNAFFQKVRSNFVSRLVINKFGSEFQKEQYSNFTSNTSFDVSAFVSAKLSTLFLYPLLACAVLLVVFRNFEFHSYADLAALGHKGYSKVFLILFGVSASLAAHFVVFKLIEMRPHQTKSIMSWSWLIHDGTFFSVVWWYVIFVMYR
jgi:hypothetical protein